jgi:hypothetical protein
MQEINNLVNATTDFEVSTTTNKFMTKADCTNLGWSVSGSYATTDYPI